MAIEIPSQLERNWDEPSTADTLRFAVVGMGWFGREVGISAIEASEYCSLGAVVSGSRSKAKEVAAEHEADVALTYDEFEEGDGTDAYDAVYIATPNARHLPFVEAAARHEKAVLCEKPLEATADRAEQLVEAAEEADIPLMTAYRMQTTRSVRWIRELIRDGVIGDPVQVNGEFSFNILAGDGDPDQWRLSKELAGGGALMDIGVYPMNTARFVLDRDPESVVGSWHATNPHYEAGVDEHVSFQLAFPDAITASCSASFGASGFSRFAVLGSEGRIVIEHPFGVDADRRLTVATGGEVTQGVVEEPNEMNEEFDYFATKVLSDEPIRPDGRHGLLDVQIAEGVYESDRTGNRVTL